MADYHSFSVDVAEKYGIQAAILLYNLAFWIEKNNADERHLYDGNVWTYSSIAAMEKLFPYMSERVIRYSIQKLIDEGIIVDGNYNKSTYDRTKWYALTDKGKELCQNCQMHSVKLSNGFGKNVEPIPDSNTDSEKKEINKERKEQSKKSYGTFNNVRLTDVELSKLQTMFKDYQTRIDTMSEYIASKGDRYKSHYATILNWYRRENGGKSVAEKEYF